MASWVLPSREAKPGCAERKGIEDRGAIEMLATDHEAWQQEPGD